MTTTSLDKTKRDCYNFVEHTTWVLVPLGCDLLPDLSGLVGAGRLWPRNETHSHFLGERAVPLALPSEIRFFLMPHGVQGGLAWTGETLRSLCPVSIVLCVMSCCRPATMGPAHLANGSFWGFPVPNDGALGHGSTPKALVDDT